jgi:hypothetical protein
MSNARFSILQARAISDIRISDAQFRTLAALGMYADKNGWCFPSLKTLGVDLNKSPQAVGRDTIALRKLGYLQVKNRYDTKTKARHSNLYRLLFDFNMDDSTLSTPEVDTLSTPEVDVNVPLNDPINRNDLEIKRKEKQDVIDYHLGIANFPGAKQLARVNSILSYLGETFHKNVETKEWREFAKYIDGEHTSKGWDVKRFIEWLYGQKNFDLQYWPVKKMRENYPAAFVQEVSESLEAQGWK